MRRRRRHWSGYHEWPSATPVIDAIAAVIAVASVVIGGHAALFLALGMMAGEAAAAAQNALFFVGIGVANGGVEIVRRWYRHHG
jgi:hypothetical protein